MTPIDQAITFLEVAKERGELTDFQITRLRRIYDKPKCPACWDRGGWYSPDNGQWVSCSCPKAYPSKEKANG